MIVKSIYNGVYLLDGHPPPSPRPIHLQYKFSETCAVIGHYNRYPMSDEHDDARNSRVSLTSSCLLLVTSMYSNDSWWQGGDVFVVCEMPMWNLVEYTEIMSRFNHLFLSCLAMSLFHAFPLALGGLSSDESELIIQNYELWVSACPWWATLWPCHHYWWSQTRQHRQVPLPRQYHVKHHHNWWGDQPPPRPSQRIF